jgi:hypothetical protein
MLWSHEISPESGDHTTTCITSGDGTVGRARTSVTAEPWCYLWTLDLDPIGRTTQWPPAFLIVPQRDTASWREPAGARTREKVPVPRLPSGLQRG